MGQKQLLAVMLLTGLSAAAQTTLYDNFDNKLLNPSKWTTIGSCFTSNGDRTGNGLSA